MGCNVYEKHHAQNMMLIVVMAKENCTGFLFGYWGLSWANYLYSHLSVLMAMTLCTFCKKQSYTTIQKFSKSIQKLIQKGQ